MRVSLACLLACALWSCDEPAPSAPPRAASAAGVVSTTAPAPPVERFETVDDTPDPPGGDDPETDDPSPEDACAPPDPSLKPMQLLRFTWASGIEGRDAKDKLHIARPGQRVYAHLHVRNRSGRPRCLHFTFRVGNKKRTEVTLKIGKSWNWRTWAYNTLKADDRAPLHLTVTDDQGKTVVDQKIAVVSE